MREAVSLDHSLSFPIDAGRHHGQRSWTPVADRYTDFRQTGSKSDIRLYRRVDRVIQLSDLYPSKLPTEGCIGVFRSASTANRTSVADHFVRIRHTHTAAPRTGVEARGGNRTLGDLRRKLAQRWCWRQGCQDVSPVTLPTVRCRERSAQVDELLLLTLLRRYRQARLRSAICGYCGHLMTLLCIEMVYKVVHAVASGAIHRSLRRVISSKLRDAGSVCVQMSMCTRCRLATDGIRRRIRR